MPPATQADCGWKAILQLLAPNIMIDIKSLRASKICWIVKYH